MNIKDQTNKEVTFSGDEQELAKQLNEQKQRILNDFATAYLAEVQLLPSQIELVEQQIDNNGTPEYILFFRQKQS